MSDCEGCRLNDLGEQLPLRERIYTDTHWRVAHGWSALPGWLIVVSQRHLVSLSDLDDAEAASLGPILRAASVALREVVRCEKTYVLLYAETGHHHVHFHVVPRMADFGADERGTAVFRFLDVPETEQVPAAERDELASRIGEAMRRELTRGVL